MRHTGPRSALQARVAVVVAFAHLVAALGLPLPPPATPGESAAYPCRDRPCGCATAAECWRGDCCCFTLEQKLAWAEARRFEPPAHVRPLVAARRASQAQSRHDCCSAKPAAPRVPAAWLAAGFVGKCRGDGPHGAPQPDPAVAPPACPVTLGSPHVERLNDRHLTATPVPSPPPLPPPRDC